MAQTYQGHVQHSHNTHSSVRMYGSHCLHLYVIRKCSPHSNHVVTAVIRLFMMIPCDMQGCPLPTLHWDTTLLPKPSLLPQTKAPNSLHKDNKRFPGPQRHCNAPAMTMPSLYSHKVGPCLPTFPSDTEIFHCQHITVLPQEYPAHHPH